MGLDSKTKGKFAVGIDLGGTNLRAALVNESGAILAQARCKTPVEEGPEAMVQAMKSLIDQVSVSGKPFAVGIGVPGPVSRVEKVVYQTPNLPGLEGFPIVKRLEEVCGFPVALNNDAKCATFGEYKFGKARGKKNFILMTFGTGLGSGIFVNGEMLYGKSDKAGEVGHLTLYPKGHSCKCGNFGCFEQYCSATALKRRAFEKTGKDYGGKEVFDAYTSNEPWAKELIADFSEDLAYATASLVNIFEPEMIVFGGGLFTTGGGPLCGLVRESIKKKCFLSSQKDLEICASSLGGDAGVLGAASLVF